MEKKLEIIVEKLENPKVRWAVVFLGVAILWRFKLHLFAAALPVMAYWHWSQQSEEGREQQQDGEFDNEPVSSRKPQDFEDDDEGFDDDDIGFRPAPSANKEEMDPYGEDFWGGNAPSGQRRSPPPEESSSFLDDDDFGFGGDKKKAPSTMNRSSWDDDPSGGPLNDDDIIPNLKGLGGMGGFGSLGGDDFLSSLDKDTGDSFVPDFGLGGGDMDFLTESMGSGFGRGGGKGKGKGKKGDREGKGEKGPREVDPKQLFVAGVGDASEEDLREFFEEKGQIERLKILRDDTGNSKGVCFVTFATVDQAQDALSLHGSVLPSGGRGITVRPAGGNKGDKDKGGGKGKQDRDRRDRRDDDDERSPFGGFGSSERSERNNERFGGLGDGDREFRPRGGGGGKGKGGNRRNERSELDELIEEELASPDNALLRAGDFDFPARRILGELRKLDKRDQTHRFEEAVRHVIKYSNGKEDRSAVRKWTAYVYKLLCTFDQELADSLRAKDAERKGGGGFRDRDDRDRTDFSRD